jgi:uncharacterized integral membrane protein
MRPAAVAICGKFSHSGGEFYRPARPGTISAGNNSMNRIQNAVLVVWVVLLLLFAAFNWQMVWRPVEIVFLFQEFNMPVILWLILGGIGASGLLRAMSELEVRTRRRRADKEIHAIKAKAFDGLSGEFDKLVSQLQSQLGDRIQTMLGEQGGEKPADGETPPPEKADQDDKDDEDAPPKLSAETTATLAELKSSSGGKEENKAGEKPAEEKPKRRWRKKKS